MGNPLLVFWVPAVDRRGAVPNAGRGAGGCPTASATQASATIFLVMRRMRAPLIVLIVIFAVSTLGLTLIPGQDAEGRPWRMGFFDAFYVMSYTASTIGFGEIPYAFTYNQRMWVTISIYLTVVGWAYAIGSLLALVQERSFRQALALQHFTRKVRRLAEPFLLIAGYGQTGELLARSLDALGRRFVVIDNDSRAHRRPLPRLLPRRRARARRRRGRPGPPGRRRPRPPVLRGRARDHRQRRGQPRGHPGRRAAPARPARDHADGLAGDGGAHERLRLPDRGQPVRPVRRPPPPRPARSGVLPAADLAGERPGRAAAEARQPAVGRPLDRVRLRPVRPGGDPRPARRGVRRDDRRVRTSSAERSRRDRRPRLRAARAHRGRASSGPPASSPAPTTTPRTCRWSPPRTAPTRGCSSPPGRTSRPARRCSPPSTSTRCSCPPRSSRTRCTRSCRRRCSGGSSGRCPRGATTGPTASWAG